MAIGAAPPFNLRLFVLPVAVLFTRNCALCRLFFSCKVLVGDVVFRQMVEKDRMNALGLIT